MDRTVQHVKVKEAADGTKIIDIKYHRSSNMTQNPIFRNAENYDGCKKLLYALGNLTEHVTDLSGFGLDWGCEITAVVWREDGHGFWWVTLRGEHIQPSGTTTFACPEQVVGALGVIFQKNLAQVESAALAMVDADVEAQAAQLGLFPKTETDDREVEKV